MSLVVFFLIRLIPTDTVDLMIANYATSPEVVENLRSFFGLDKPIIVQYWDWLKGLFAGDFGLSLRSGRTFLSDIALRFPITLEIVLMSVGISVLLGIPTGIISAIKRNKAPDFITRILAMLGLSLPTFWVGEMAIIICSHHFGWLPKMQYVSFFDSPVNNIKACLLPSVILGTLIAGSVTRMTRSSMLEVLEQDYIRTARAKGVYEKTVIYKHAMRNAFIPVLTVIGGQMTYLFGNILVVEEVFSIPGLGRYIINAISQRDYPIVQSSLLFIGIVIALINLTVDILYAVVDPRIKYN